jgi:hypothetical protein
MKDDRLTVALVLSAPTPYRDRLHEFGLPGGT